MTLITVSRQLGSHGGEISAQVAEALGLRFVDRQIIRQAAHPPYARGLPAGAGGLYTVALRGHPQPGHPPFRGHHGRLRPDGRDGDPGSG